MLRLYLVPARLARDPASFHLAASLQPCLKCRTHAAARLHAPPWPWPSASTCKAGLVSLYLFHLGSGFGSLREVGIFSRVLCITNTIACCSAPTSHTSNSRAQPEPRPSPCSRPTPRLGLHDRNLELVLHPPLLRVCAHAVAPSPISAPPPSASGRDGRRLARRRRHPVPL